MKLTKKITSLFLVGVMTFNQFAPLVQALEEVSTANKENVVAPIENSSVSLSNEELAKGNIEVELNFVLPIRNSANADVTLKIYDREKNSIGVRLSEIYEMYQDGYLTKDINLGNQTIKVSASKRDNKGNLLSGTDETKNIVYLAVNFNDLVTGKYTLELTGKNYLTYTTEVTLDEFSKRVNITNEKGMFALGDVTNDGKIDSNDTEEMLKAINKNDLNKDLNLDGVTNIADLNYITANINNSETKAEIRKTSPILSSENVALSINDSANIENDGKLSDIFTGEGVTLKQNGEEPINLELDLTKGSEEAMEMSQIRINFGEHVPEAAHLIVETVDGEKTDYHIPAVEDSNGIYSFTENETEGTRVIKLHGQVAVKKVTIVIDTPGSDNLADIAKVEFLNNVKVETKEPENFYTPKNIQVDASVSEQVTVTFNEVPNVTGYEIRINGDKMKDVIFQTTYTKFTIEDLKNYVEYGIEVQSVNNEWESGWSKVVKATPQATRRPPAVDMVEAEGTFGGINFKWKKMDDTKSYNLYYREVGKSWQKVEEEITTNSYSLRGLLPNTKYEAYLTGNNDLGEGAESQHVMATTLVEMATIYPKYNLINDTIIDGRTNHIKDVILNKGTMTDNYKFAMVDDNYKTNWTFTDWAAGSHYNQYGMPTIVLDNSYEMDEFVLTVPDDFKYTFKSGTYNKDSDQYNDTLVYYWNTDEERTQKNATVVPGIITSKKDENGRIYYVLKLEKPIVANAIQLGLTNAASHKLVQVSELKFYEYDSLVDDVANLFVDDLRVELKTDVDQNKINELRKRADHQNHGEYNPYRDSVLQDLEYAEKILNDEKLNDVITLNPNISNSYDNLGFAMTISDYQPMGVAVTAGEQINIYVGTTGKVNVEAVFTQNYAEANTWSSKVTLKKGQNIITVPKIGSASSERGGSLYIRYTSKPDINNPIKIRVSGGTKIPMLDTTLTEGNEKATKEAITNYINELDEYVNNLKDLYAEKYRDSEDEEKFSYDAKTSVLGVTEIVTRHGLWSFSAEAVRDAINSKLTTIDDKVNRLYESTEAFDEMMELFYRHKGLSAKETDAKKKIPSARINIRYMRMFDGAFMYAGGYHVGIEYGSIAGVIQGKRNTQSATGYFGWGISHEVGHQINQGNLAHAEVTNNIYSLLAQTANDTDKSRLEISNIYEKIYDKVTSHTLGKAQNVFVTLGMYWQLHLAYDGNKTFDDTESVFAKINTESRTYDNSQKKYSKDDLLILLASRAVKKDLTDYFAIWGLKAIDAVKQEIVDLGYEKETKAIYYLNDAARRYKLNNGTEISNKNILNASIKKQDDANKRITLTFNVNEEKDKILGYEILRNGESIAFVEKDNTKDVMEFTDNIGSVNNRAFTYEVVAYDYLLNQTNKVSLDEIKVKHDGSVKKDTFTIESNFKETKEVVDYENADLDYKTLKVNNLIDGKNETVFNGTERVKTLTSSNSKVEMNSDNNNAYVIINLNTKMSLSGIEYTGLVEDNGLLDSNTIRKYKISVSSNKENWIEARTGEFSLTDKNNYTDKVYFMKENTTSQTQLWTYHDISYIKIESVGNKDGISGAEINIIAPPGDNIDFDGSIGKLQEDYCYLTAGCNENVKDEEGNVVGIIKAGSVIFEGTYAGSPSFNILTIADAKDKNKIYEGYQLIFAEINDDLTVYEVSEGSWLYVMTEEQYNKVLEGSTTIRANLYRVADVENLSGQRLTSDSKAITNLKPYNSLANVTISNKQ